MVLGGVAVSYERGTPVQGTLGTTVQGNLGTPAQGNLDDGRMQPALAVLLQALLHYLF